MDDHLTSSTFQLFEKYPNAESARVYFEAQRWNGKPVCPHDCCAQVTKRGCKRVGYYRCHKRSAGARNARTGQTRAYAVLSFGSAPNRFSPA